ncbi:MAG TPA: GNAT family N-acetyltransferase [Xanthomonadaceae bacterium]|nr:GNAT family N-acetyltransferase [Xanthomonadaceae bacterium]
MRIASLADVPRHLPALASAHVQAFGGLLPDWTEQQARAELATHRRGGIPDTWLALDGDEWLGSVSLLRADPADLPQYSPWLASLLVRPQARSQGLGAQLVAHCVAMAARLGVAELFLYCVEARVPFYQRLGWRRHARLPLASLPVVVMRIDSRRTADD